MDDDEFNLRCLAAVSALVIAHIVLKRRKKLRRKRTLLWMRPLFQRRADLGTANTLLRELTASSAALLRLQIRIVLETILEWIWRHIAICSRWLSQE